MDSSPNPIDSQNEGQFDQESNVPKLTIKDGEAFATKNFPDMGQEVVDQGFIVWEIDNWSSLPAKAHSLELNVGGNNWRILVFPRGNHGNTDAISLYAEVVPPEQCDEQWSVCAQFLLVISNSEHPEVDTVHPAHHRFNKTEVDWGFNKVIDQRNFSTPYQKNSLPFLENNKVTLSLFVRVIKDTTGVLWHSFINYDSKKSTGYVGLLNQGATCYMNSLLQSLYFTNYFRKAVFKIPTENDSPNNSVTLALQRVFLALQNSNTTVGTNELTKSFGWDSMDSFMQHDVQEFNRVLQDNLEGKMKGTAAEGAIQKLFVGKMKSYIACTQVQYESSRIEDYYDIQLNVKGCKNIRESFENYIEVEELDGDNKYMAEGYGLQAAKKGVIFDSFPPVLHLQLKRFDYDFVRDAMVKINDRYEFPESIDLSDFLSKDVDCSEPWDYQLHGVLVHSGDLHGGHYFALLKPTPDGKWFKFDDDRVTPATFKEVFEDSFGTNAPNMSNPTEFRHNMRSAKRFSNAYMLVYIRKSRLSEILSDVTVEDVPSHITQTIENENAAVVLAQQKKTEMDLQIGFQVYTDEDLKVHSGSGILNLKDVNLPQTPFLSLNLAKTCTLSDLKFEIGNQLSIDPDTFRLWVVAERDNRTLRVFHPIPDTEKDTALTLIKDKYIGRRMESLIYVELPYYIIYPSKELPTIEKKTPILIMLKYYDDVNNTIKYIGKFYAQFNTGFSDIACQLKKDLGFNENTLLELFEEVKPNLIDPIPLDQTVGAFEITNGDIICFQKALISREDEMETLPVQGILAYFENLFNQVRVCFKPKSTTTNFNQIDLQNDIILDLNKKMKYSEFVPILASKIQADPLKLRLHQPNGYKSLITTPVAFEPESLLGKLDQSNSNSGHDMMLYYELLEVTLIELESKSSFKVTVLGSNLKDETEFNLLVPRDGSMGDLTKILEIKLMESNRPFSKVRLYQADYNRFAGYFSNDFMVSEIEHYVNIYAEEDIDFPEGELNLPVFHFCKVVTRSHGIPFLFSKIKGESFDSFKSRLAIKLGITDKELAANYKLAKINARDNPPIIPDFIETDEQWELCDFGPDTHLGLDHRDKSIKTSRFGEKAIKIFN